MIGLDPLTTWREETGRKFLSLDFAPVGDQPFRFSIEPIAVSDDVRICRIRNSPGFSFRDKALAASSNLDTLGFVYSLSGRLGIQQQGQEMQLLRGQPIMLDNGIPRHTGSSSSSNRITIIVERKHIFGPDCGQGPLFDSPWSRPSQALLLLQRYIAMLRASPLGSSSQQLTTLSCQHVLALLRAAAAEQLAHRRDSNGAEDLSGARVRLAQADIRDNHADPELTVDAVAGRLGISARQLQRLFEQAGIKFTESVNDLRLESVHQALTSPQSSSRTVLDIALAAGFSDVSHFNRLFKRRFDATPKALRSRGQNGGNA